MSADGAPVERLLDVATRPLVSVFMPDRLELVKGPPALRRSHLDQLVAAIWPARAQTRRQYSQVLAQRNALLSRIRAGRASDSTLSSWDHELAAGGARAACRPPGAITLLEQPFAQRVAQLGLRGARCLEYRPRTRAADVEEYVAELQERSPATSSEDSPAHGPHRDELSLLRDGRELRVYGSQGEQRLALLALLLAERDVLAAERGRTPLMLLDDVMSELDAERRELLATELRADGQSVIATTELGHVPGAMDAAVTRLRVSSGAILQEALAA